MPSGRVKQYRYTLGEAIVFGDDFEHATQTGSSPEPLAFLCFTFGDRKCTPAQWESALAYIKEQGPIYCTPSGVLVGSRFTHDGDGWTIAGNVGTSALATAVSWEPSSRVSLLNRYVYATATTPPGPRQYNFVRTDPTKTAILAKYASQPDGSYMRTPSGEVFTVSSFAKILILAINKFSLIDPEGMGLEMEGGKPGWNDAMNGLCALFGSGMPEMYELIRTLKFAKGVTEDFPARDVVLPAEIDTLLMKSVDLVDQYNSDDLTDFQFWDQLAQARDSYRNATSVYFSGETVSWATGSLKHMLSRAFPGSGEAESVLRSELNGDETYEEVEVDVDELLAQGRCVRVDCTDKKSHDFALFAPLPGRPVSAEVRGCPAQCLTQ